MTIRDRDRTTGCVADLTTIHIGKNGQPKSSDELTDQPDIFVLRDGTKVVGNRSLEEAQFVFDIRNAATMIAMVDAKRLPQDIKDAAAKVMTFARIYGWMGETK